MGAGKVGGQAEVCALTIETAAHRVKIRAMRSHAAIARRFSRTGLAGASAFRRLIPPHRGLRPTACPGIAAHADCLYSAAMFNGKMDGAEHPREGRKELRRGLKNRHIQMIALGGAIGTGLFYGSAASISLAGPAVLPAYLLGGTVIWLILRMMGEMAVAEPVAGAFSHFAYAYWGEFPGFLSGWNYWFLYVAVNMTELSVVGVYVNYWLPDFPQWLAALLVLVGVTAVNLVQVRLYGELEFWFALIKVAAVMGMIGLGALLVILSAAHPPQAADGPAFANLWTHGGFFPHGLSGMLLSLVLVMFSFGGTELITITAAEADNPQKSLPRAVRQVLRRILLFYMGALTVIMILYPWNRVGMDGSPFVLIFSELGIPAAAGILNLVVLSAAVSVYNSGAYSNARMLYSLARQGNAPAFFAKLNRHGVPYMGTLFSTLCTAVIVLLNRLFPGKVFLYVVSIATAAALLTWGMIALTHMRFRRIRDARGLGGRDGFRAPGCPWLNRLCLAFLALVLALMTQLDSMRPAALALPLWLAALYAGFRLKKARERHGRATRRMPPR